MYKKGSACATNRQYSFTISKLSPDLNVFRTISIRKCCTWTNSKWILATTIETYKFAAKQMLCIKSVEMKWPKERAYCLCYTLYTYFNDLTKVSQKLASKVSELDLLHQLKKFKKKSISNNNVRYEQSEFCLNKSQMCYFEKCLQNGNHSYSNINWLSAMSHLLFADLIFNINYIILLAYIGTMNTSQQLVIMQLNFQFHVMLNI